MDEEKIKLKQAVLRLEDWVEEARTQGLSLQETQGVIIDNLISCCFAFDGCSPRDILEVFHKSLEGAFEVRVKMMAKEKEKAKE